MRFVLVAVLAFAVALPAGIQRSGLLMNYSDSVPLGLYRRVPSNSANRAISYAGFCLPRATANAAIQAGLDVVPGVCTDGLAPVLKPVICPSPEHPLIYDARGFCFNGNLLPNTAPKVQSRTGVELEHYPFGAYTSGMWAVSEFNANSYDSRYFGPVAPDVIRFYAKPVWTW
jgi:conjugative transfer signal peptidase TraF